MNKRGRLLACALLLLLVALGVMEHDMTDKRSWWWVIAALLLMGLAAACARIVSQAPVAPQNASAESPRRVENTSSASQRDYVLEVIGLGVTLDKYRQGVLWDGLARGHPYASLREQDPKKYPWSWRDKLSQEGGRSNDTFENGVRLLPMHTGIPTFTADSSVLASRTSATSPASTIGDATGPGLSFQLYVAAGWEMAERPDRLVERVFAFFDEHADVPFVVLNAADGLYFRDRYRAENTPPLIRDGYYVPEMPASSALLVLARRERVDAIRRYAFDDFSDGDTSLSVAELNRRGYSRRLFLAYDALRYRVPKPAGMPRRDPTLAEWLQETAAFARRPDIVSGGADGRRPPSAFRPTPWFPIPWNKEQLAAFDRLPTYGYLHRPVYVPMLDAQGQPLTRRDARAAALADGWKQALQTLPEAQRPAAPARVVLATAGNVDQQVLLSSVLNAWSDEGGPPLDRADSSRWIDTDARLGNTGAATWFMQMAIGLMGSYRGGGASAAINLRDPAEASIVFVTPPSDELRRTQRHPRGGDVLRNATTPAYDPATYAE